MYYCIFLYVFFIFFFFFQAEDGIRDVAVTGVQTCALPISRHHRCDHARRNVTTGHERPRRLGQLSAHRSEEHTSELQSRLHLVCRLLLEKKKKNKKKQKKTKKKTKNKKTKI